MGVPKFFRYISERYPCLSELVKEFQIPDFDNLYLDMNGIIHACSHPNDFEPHFSITEETIFASIFHYIEVLFNIIKPKKLFFMAVDGVAPRAKMNQQRARRFRSAKEAETKVKEALRSSKTPLPQDRFDSNCITPGTVFMDRLHSQLKYFVTRKISTDPLWQSCKIILSGHQTPGEGEHKIMDYIRYLKTQPDYNENTTHCLYGLDADLIMLGLCTHEPHFSLLREKVRFSRQQKKKITSPDETEFYLLHLSLLREYLDLEFQELKDTLPFQYNLENIIDDWVLMGFLVGNDFIPNLPDLHLGKGALPILYKAYKEVLPSLDGYLNENGYLNLARFEQYMEKMAKFDLEVFEDAYANLSYLEEKPKNSLREQNSNGLPEKNAELEELIKATEEFELSEDESFEDNNDNEDEMFLWEFSQHKKHYYRAKLDYGQVTPEVLKSQAEGYIRAIQWNLHYYYQGCQSWSWYYPHHYSPYISDIRNFKDLKLDFELGKPFLPFEQLLAVLPAASKNLLPAPYHDLMTSPNSPIKDFYPDDFQTDLNGKEHDWEAVVLIPFIDEKRLLEAMKEANERLSPDEIRRNQHGPMHVFTFTEENLGLYKSIEYFPNVSENHALVKDVSTEEILVDPSELKYGLRPGALLGVYYPGFPTLSHIPFKASLKLAKVRIFKNFSKDHNMVLSLNERECPSLEVLAKELLGKIIHVNWPHLVESRAVAVSDGKVRYSITENGCQKDEVLEKGAQLKWAAEVRQLTMCYLQKLGVKLGRVNVVVYALSLEGRKYVFEPRGKVVMEKLWSTSPNPVPLQTVVTDLPLKDLESQCFSDFNSCFPINSVVFMLGQPHFGSKGRVLESTECLKKGRVKVAMEIVNDLFLPESLLKSEPKTVYLPFRVAAQKVGVAPRLLSRITGVIIVVTAENESSSTWCQRFNVGLNMKWYKKDGDIPGYVKRDNYNFMYSMAAVEVACNYVEKFARVVEYLSDNPTTNVFMLRDIFPGPEGLSELKEMVAWVKNQEYNKVEKLETGTEILSSGLVSKIEKMVEDWPKKRTVLQMEVKPHLLYKSDLVFGNVAPVKSAKHRLLDRVVSIRSSYTVPTGLRGFIVAIRPASSDTDTMYDVLFDQPFVGGMKLNSSTEKVFRMSVASFLNISDAKRQFERSPTAVFDPISSRTPAPSNGPSKLPSKPTPNLPINLPSVSLRPCYTEIKTSAFAQWTQQPPPPSGNGNEDFKEIWSNLQRAKPQEDALKKILKIEKKEKDVEDPVKTFFEKMSQGSEKAPKPSPAGPPRNRYYRQLLGVFKLRKWGQPNFKFSHGNGKVVARLCLSDGRVFPGLPCEEKESACESAALRALSALGEIPTSKEALLQVEEDKRQQQPQQLFPQPLPVARGMDYSLVYRANMLPPVLPNPPSQWVLGAGPMAPRCPTLNLQTVMYTPSGENFYPRARLETAQRPLIMPHGAIPHGAIPHGVIPHGAIPHGTIPHGANRKLSASALEFVPLQAIVGKRKPGRMTIARNPPQPAEAQKKTEVVATFYNVAGSSSSTSKPKRRSKIAAKLDFDPNLD